MERKELFKIFDACNPSVEDVRIYLDHLCGETPLELFFTDVNGQRVYSHQILKDATFQGVVIEDTLYYSRAVTKEDVKKKPNAGDIRAFAQQISPLAHPITKQELNLLAKNWQDYMITYSILAYHKLKMAGSHKYYALVPEDNNSTYCDYSGALTDGNAELGYFLESANIWICEGVNKN